jgi:hypothetical protein
MRSAVRNKCSARPFGTMRPATKTDSDHPAFPIRSVPLCPRSAGQLSSITCHAAHIPKIHHRPRPITADRPNHQPQSRNPKVPQRGARRRRHNQIAIARGSSRTQLPARSFPGGFRTTAPLQAQSSPWGRHPKPFTKPEGPFIANKRDLFGRAGSLVGGETTSAVHPPKPHRRAPSSAPLPVAARRPAFPPRMDRMGHRRNTAAGRPGRE